MVFLSQSRRSSATSSGSERAEDFYSLTATMPRGKTLHFEDFRGKVVLIVNTASKCGFTPQYTFLQTLHERYSSQGLVVLGFPCDQFGGQEPDADSTIASSCLRNHGVTFPLTSKSNVNGPSANPVFRYLKGEKRGVMGERLMWNFTKFVVDREGKVVGRYAPTTKPESLEGVLRGLLGEEE